MTNFTHSGTEITLLPGGQFSALVAGRRIVKPSLAAIKKAIDNSAKNAFEPFLALCDVRYGETIGGVDLKSVKVIGIANDTGYRSRREKRKVFVADNEGRAVEIDKYKPVYINNPAAIAAATALSEHESETSAIMEKIREEREALKDELDKFRVLPESYVQKQESKS